MHFPSLIYGLDSLCNRGYGDSSSFQQTGSRLHLIYNTYNIEKWDLQMADVAAWSMGVRSITSAAAMASAVRDFARNRRPRRRAGSAGAAAAAAQGVLTALHPCSDLFFGEISVQQRFVRQLDSAMSWWQLFCLRDMRPTLIADKGACSKHECCSCALGSPLPSRNEACRTLFL